MKYELVIFDCDGTLVDSEPLTNGLIAVMMTEIGLPMTLDDSLRLFKGKSFTDITNYIDDNLDHALEFSFEESFRQRSQILFEAELKAIDGAEEFIQKVNCKKCVASNGPKRKMETTLSVTGLDKYFLPEEIFSAYDINVWKPEPDLFLYACRQMNVSPDKALIIEDTMSGAMAARNANIENFIFCAEDAQQFIDAGFRTFSDYNLLQID